MENYNFDDIRSYRDEEIHEKLLGILDDAGFIYVLKKLYSDERIAHLKRELISDNKPENIEEFLELTESIQNQEEVKEKSSKNTGNQFFS